MPDDLSSERAGPIAPRPTAQRSPPNLLVGLGRGITGVRGARWGGRDVRGGWARPRRFIWPCARGYRAWC